MYPSEDAKRPLAHVTSNIKNSKQMSETSRVRTRILSVTTAERSHSAIVTFLDEIKSLHRVYWLILEIAPSGPRNLRGEIIVYIPAHEYLIKFLDFFWGVVNCNTNKKKLPLLHSINDFGCEISIKQNIATTSKIQDKLAWSKLFHDIALWGFD